jgi:hypothetical protein
MDNALRIGVLGLSVQTVPLLSVKSYLVSDVCHSQASVNIIILSKKLRIAAMFRKCPSPVEPQGWFFSHPLTPCHTRLIQSTVYLLLIRPCNCHNFQALCNIS